MPIKGFLERKRMRRIGIVRLGIKVLSDKINPKTGEPIEYPQPTQYFVLKDAPGLAEIYGEKPKILNVLILSEDLNIAFPYFMMRYRRRGLACMGDGEHILRRQGEDGKWEVAGGVNLQTGEIEICHALGCHYAIRGEAGRAECQPTGRFRFICADQPTHGYYQLTVRKRAIEGFLGQIEFAKSILGHITGYPWQLILEQETVQLESGQRKLWIPQLEIKPEIFQALLEQKHKAGPLALPEGITAPTPEMDKELTEDLDYEANEEALLKEEKLIVLPEAKELPDEDPSEAEAIADAFPQAEVKGVEVALPQAKVGGPSLTLEERWAAGIKKLAGETGFSDEAIEELLKRWADKPRTEGRYQDALRHIEASVIREEE